MINEITYYKNVFRITLQPIIDLLDHKKTQLSEQDWIRFMEITKSSIQANPDQFLGKELPSRAVIQQIVDDIFVDYLKEQTVEI
jgi:hypothetical protein